MPVQKHINLKKAKAEGVKIEKTAQGYALTIPAEGGKLIFSGLPGFLGGVRWKGMTPPGDGRHRKGHHGSDLHPGICYTSCRKRRYVHHQCRSASADSDNLAGGAVAAGQPDHVHPPHPRQIERDHSWQRNQPEKSGGDGSDL